MASQHIDGTTRLLSPAEFRSFLGDEAFWLGARFHGCLAGANGSVIPLEAELQENDIRYALSGRVEFDDKTSISIEEFFSQWTKARPWLQ